VVGVVAVVVGAGVLGGCACDVVGVVSIAFDVEAEVDGEVDCVVVDGAGALVVWSSVGGCGAFRPAPFPPAAAGSCTPNVLTPTGTSWETVLVVPRVAVMLCVPGARSVYRTSPDGLAVRAAPPSNETDAPAATAPVEVVTATVNIALT
jgi:hypothetical protein